MQAWKKIRITNYQKKIIREVLLEAAILLFQALYMDQHVFYAYVSNKLFSLVPVI